MRSFFENERKFLIVLFIVALVIRVSFSVVSYNRNVMERFSDDKGYMENAQQVIAQGPLLLNTKAIDEWFVGPGLPYIMAGLMLLFGKSWLVIFLFNSLLGSSNCVLSYFLAKKVTGSHIIGVISSVWFCFYVLFIKYIPTAGKEPWMLLLFGLTIYLIISVSEVKNYLRLTVMIFAFTYLIHLDERFFGFFPIIIFYLYYLNNNKKLGLKHSIFFTISVLILMVPWLVRNYYVYQKIVILTPRTEHLTDPIFGYKGSNYIITDGQQMRWFISESDLDSIQYHGKVTFENGEIIEQSELDALRKGIRPKRMSAMESYISNFIILWKPVDFQESFVENGYKFDGKWSWKHNLSSFLTYGILIPFAFIGFYFLYRRNKKIACFLLFIIFYYTLLHVFFIPITVNRYRVPIDIFIIILGACGIYRTNLILKEKNNNKLNSA
ncbi:hypothetical protein BH10BAC5_BH10BAC5_11500 [soil metagenome]